MSDGVSRLIDLPSEILDLIFTFMQHDEILSARQCCSLLGEIGREHMMRDVILVYERRAFSRLRAIANDPEFSKRVKSLYYQADRFATVQPYDAWNLCRDGGNSLSHSNLTGKTLSVFSPDELARAYKAYESAAQDQHRIHWEEFDAESLAVFFEKCESLEQLTITLEHGPKDRPEMLRSAFKDSLCRPYGDGSSDFRGHEQFQGLVNALSRHCPKLKHLAIVNISLRALYMPKTIWYRFLESVRRLRSLHLKVDLMFIPGMVFVSHDHSRAHPRLLEWASELRHLKLDIGMNQKMRALIRHFPFLDAIAGPAIMPNLQTLSISSFTARESEWIDFLLRHGSTIVSLSLSQIYVYEGMLSRVIEGIGGKLAKLQHVRLRHVFVDQDGEYNFGYDKDNDSSNARIVEDFIRNGGDFSSVAAFLQGSRRDILEMDLPYGHA